MTEILFGGDTVSWYWRANPARIDVGQHSQATAACLDMDQANSRSTALHHAAMQNRYAGFTHCYPAGAPVDTALSMAPQDSFIKSQAPMLASAQPITVPALAPRPIAAARGGIAVRGDESRLLEARKRMRFEPCRSPSLAA